MAGRRWIRLDAEWEESAWLDALDGDAAGCWPRLLCWVKLRGKGGRCKAPDVGVLARRWRVSERSVHELMDAAKADRALSFECDELVLTNWDEYQEPDPTAAERKRRQRERESPTPPTSQNVSHGDVTDVTRDKGVTRQVTPDPRQGQGVSAGSSPVPEKKILPDAEETRANGPPSPPAEVVALLEDFPDAIEAVMGMAHPGSLRGTIASLRLSFLYENEGKAAPDNSMKGKGFAERQRLTARALVDMQAKGVKNWSPAALSGFVANLTAERLPRTSSPYGNETQRDLDRANEARRRASDNAAQERQESEDKAKADVKDAWEWFNALPTTAKAELEAKCQANTRNLGKLSEGLSRGILLGIIAEERKRGAA